MQAPASLTIRTDPRNSGAKGSTGGTSQGPSGGKGVRGGPHSRSRERPRKPQFWPNSLPFSGLYDLEIGGFDPIFGPFRPRFLGSLRVVLKVFTIGGLHKMGWSAAWPSISSTLHTI